MWPRRTCRGLGILAKVSLHVLILSFFSLVLFCFGRVEFRRAMAMCGTWCCGALVSVGDVLCVYGMNSVAILGLGVSGSFGVRIPT